MVWVRFKKPGPLTHKELLEAFYGKIKVNWKRLLRPPAKQGTPWFKLPPQELRRRQQLQMTAKHRRALRLCRSVEDVRHVHQRFVDDGVEDNELLRRMLIQHYEKYHPEDACFVFRSTLRRTRFFYGLVIAAFAQNGHWKEALQTFGEMDLDGFRPEGEASLMSILDCCSSNRVPANVVLDIVGGLQQASVQLWSLIIVTLAKLGSLVEAKRTFDKLLLRQDVEVWTAMAAAYAKTGHYREALQLLHKMDLQGVKATKKTFVQLLIAVSADPTLLEQGKMLHSRCIRLGLKVDVHVNTALINMYAACGSIRDSRAAFDHIRWKNIYAGTSMIVQYVRRGEAREALELYLDMVTKKVQLQDRTIAAALEACAMLGDLERGKMIYKQAMSERKSSTLVEAALVALHAKCGSLEDTIELFRRSYPTRQVMAWNALLGRFAQRGHTKQVLELLRAMELEGVEPDGVSMLCLLIVTCSRGFLARARQYFHSIQADRGLLYTVEHYSCMLTMLERRGRMQDAQDLLDNMPFQPEVQGTKSCITDRVWE